MKRICIYWLTVAFFWMAWQGDMIWSSPPGRPNPLPIAPKEAAEKLKKAEALLKQGLSAELAYQLAYEVYQKYGNVRTAWFPSWVYRKVKGPLPDPNDRLAVIGSVVEGKHGLPLNLLRRGTFTVGVLFDASCALGRLDEVVKWGEMLIQAGNESYVVHKKVEIAKSQLARGWTYRPRPKLSRINWRPLPLRFREEDYFILVPLDEACKVLKIPYRLDISPKTKRTRYVLLGEKGRIGPGLLQARNLKGDREHIAYAPFEEGGEIWVPFYWLAKQVGIRWWEVRNGKIYVALKGQ